MVTHELCGLLVPYVLCAVGDAIKDTSFERNGGERSGGHAGLTEHGNYEAAHGRTVCGNQYRM